jgi:hypothetical protein
VVTFVLRDAKHLAAGDVDHGRVAWVFLGGAAELGVAGVLFGAGQEAEAIGMLDPPRHECGLERPGLFKQRSHQPCGCPGLVNYEAAASCTGPYLCDIAWRGENAVSPSSAELAGAFCSVGDKPFAAAR